MAPVPPIPHPELGLGVTRGAHREQRHSRGSASPSEEPGSGSSPCGGGKRATATRSLLGGEQGHTQACDPMASPPRVLASRRVFALMFPGLRAARDTRGQFCAFGEKQREMSQGRAAPAGLREL